MSPAPLPPLPPPARPGFVESLLNSRFLRVLVLGLLTVLLLIPLGAIRDVIAEREQTRAEAQSEIAQQWGGAQTISGPYLVLPYRTVRDVVKDGKTVVEEGVAYGVVLPESLRIDATQTSENRQRGIFTVPVYRSTATLTGHYNKPSLASIGVPDAAIYWDRAEVVLMLSDLRALTGGVRMQAGEQSLNFQPGGGAIMRAVESGDEQDRGDIIHATWPLAADGGELRFALPLSFNGSEALKFTPVGRLTEVALQGDWPSPSFNGAYLPRSREVNAEEAPGFKAQWAIPDLSRNFGQVWRGDSIPYRALSAAAFGVRLFPSVDQYTMAHRAVKYAQLFIVMTFALWWLFEVVASVRLHLLQYLLVGAGLSAFYLLQLALAEHLGFKLAYLIASAAITVQITLYSWSALHSIWRALGVGAAMATLYGYLFAVLREENYALLTGAVGVFVMLSLIMWLTRRVQWADPTRKT